MVSNRMRSRIQADLSRLAKLCRRRDQNLTEFMTKKAHETVVVIGASPKPQRYSNKAIAMLKQFGHKPVPVNPGFSEVLGEKCYRTISDVPDKADTVTMYVGKQRSDSMIDQIVAAKPRRIIMNPGAENGDLAMAAQQAGISVDYACTLVMLQTGQF